MSLILKFLLRFTLTLFVSLFLKNKVENAEGLFKEPYVLPTCGTTNLRTVWAKNVLEGSVKEIRENKRSVKEAKI